MHERLADHLYAQIWATGIFCKRVERVSILDRADRWACDGVRVAATNVRGRAVDGIPGIGSCVNWSSDTGVESCGDFYLLCANRPGFGALFPIYSFVAAAARPSAAPGCVCARGHGAGWSNSELADGAGFGSPWFIADCACASAAGLHFVAWVLCGRKCGCFAECGDLDRGGSS